MKKYYLWIAPIFFLMVTFKEIYIVTQFTEVASISAQQAFSLWASETNVNNNYTGAQLGIVQHTDRAIYSFIIFGLFLCYSFTQRQTSHA
jgi:hypothetical protein